ncbi:MAG: CBS domain-containing protein [Chloracidobacterium sp.]|nr:CBS domain-containing protein [Chloracidobacterium sp.]
MAKRIDNLSLSRGRWTLARDLATRSPGPTPPVVRAGDDLPHVAKVTVATALWNAVYVVDDDDRYLGAVSNGRFTRRVFEQLDPGLFVNEQARAATMLSLLGRSVAGLPAQSLIEPDPQPPRGRETIADAMRALYLAKKGEVPVVNDTGRLLGAIRALDVLREWVEDKLFMQMGDETESFY